MAFFNSAIDILGTLVVALGGGVCAWGGINLLEGYGNDNPGAKSQGMKQLMAGGGVALIGITLVPLLSGLFGKAFPPHHCGKIANIIESPWRCKFYEKNIGNYPIPRNLHAVRLPPRGRVPSGYRGIHAGPTIAGNNHNH